MLCSRCWLQLPTKAGCLLPTSQLDSVSTISRQHPRGTWGYPHELARNLPSRVTTLSCSPMLCWGFITHMLLVAVTSNSSQPSSEAHTARVSSRNRSEALQRRSIMTRLWRLRFSPPTFTEIRKVMLIASKKKKPISQICLVSSRLLPWDTHTSACEIQDYKGFSPFSRLEESNPRP